MLYIYIYIFLAIIDSFWGIRWFCRNSKNATLRNCHSFKAWGRLGHWKKSYRDLTEERNLRQWNGVKNSFSVVVGEISTRKISTEFTKFQNTMETCSNVNENVRLNTWSLTQTPRTCQQPQLGTILFGENNMADWTRGMGRKWTICLCSLENVSEELCLLLDWCAIYTWLEIILVYNRLIV